MTSWLSCLILLITVLPLQALQATEEPEEAEAVAEQGWTATGSVNYVSDYYARGLSLSWHRPTVQGGVELAHASGFYAGLWGSGVSANTIIDARAEIDAYLGFNGNIAAIDKLGYSVGFYNYFYPGATWKKFEALTFDQGKPSGGRLTTSEISLGLSYDWLSTKVSYTLTNWFGAEKATGWDDNTRGSVYLELNAAYPLPWWGLTLIGHVGRMDVSAKLQASGFPTANGTPGTYATNPDYTDWKLGLSKAFKIGRSEGWNADVYWVGASNRAYWGGYGGSSFNSPLTSEEDVKSKTLNENRWVFALGKTF